jgi:hypothetical protein
MSQHQLHPLAPTVQAPAGGGLNPVRHLYYWLRWQISGTLLPDGYGGSK